MILSMTGFGRGTAVLNGREITVELRSVNSRYFEYSSRIPRTCSSLDSRLKKQLNQRISRGKVELSMTVQNVDAADTVVAVNMELARSYQQAMRDLSEQLGVKNDVSTAVLTRFPDVLTTRHADVDEEQLWQDVSAVTAQALDRFVEMRAAEGAKMKADVESRLVFLEQCVGKVESLSAGRVENYTNRLYEKLKVILQDRDIDDARVLTEAAIFGDKTAVDEETVRLRSHIAQYRDPAAGRARGPQAGLPDARAEPRDQYHRLQVSGSGYHPYCGGYEGGDRKNPRADPESGIICCGGAYETHQHRLWQYGQCGARGGSRQPGLRTGQTSGEGSTRARDADRCLLRPQHPSCAYHGLRSCRAVRPSARNGGKPRRRAGG